MPDGAKELFGREKLYDDDRLIWLPITLNFKSKEYVVFCDEDGSRPLLVLRDYLAPLKPFGPYNTFHRAIHDNATVIHAFDGLESKAVITPERQLLAEFAGMEGAEYLQRAL
jgi:hypothetical protein